MIFLPNLKKNIGKILTEQHQRQQFQKKLEETGLPKLKK